MNFLSVLCRLNSIQVLIEKYILLTASDKVTLLF